MNKIFKTAVIEFFICCVIGLGVWNVGQHLQKERMTSQYQQQQDNEHFGQSVMEVIPGDIRANLLAQLPEDVYSTYHQAHLRKDLSAKGSAIYEVHAMRLRWSPVDTVNHNWHLITIRGGNSSEYINKRILDDMAIFDQNFVMSSRYSHN